MKNVKAATPQFVRVSRANTAGMLVGFKGRGGGFQMLSRAGNADEEIADGLAAWQERKK